MDGYLSAEEAVTWLKAQPGSEEFVRACFFDDPLVEAAQRFWSGSEWSAVRAFIPTSPGTALDIGAGRGIASYALASDGWKVTALEPDPSARVGAGAIRNLVNDSGLAIEVIETWGEELPVADESLDLVYTRAVLHHAKDLRQICREIGRVLRKGGVYIAAREHVISKDTDLQNFLNAHPLHKMHGGEAAYLLEEYLDAIKGGGVQISHILNPAESDINLFPSTRNDVKRRWAGSLMWPFPDMIPDFLLTLRGALDRTPGRLYSFIGRKPLHFE